MTRVEADKSDIVERLRYGILGECPDRREAADEIERLRDLLRMWKEVASE